MIDTTLTVEHLHYLRRLQLARRLTLPCAVPSKPPTALSELVMRGLAETVSNELRITTAGLAALEGNTVK